MTRAVRRPDGPASGRSSATWSAATGGPPALAEITQLDPIYVVANISSQQALQVRANLDQRRLTLDELHKIPIEAALSDETGFPHHGAIEYVAPQIDPQTGTLYVRGILRNPDRTLLPGMFVNMRLPMGKVTKSALLVPADRAAGRPGRPLPASLSTTTTSCRKRYVQLGEASRRPAGRDQRASTRERPDRGRRALARRRRG